MALSSLSLTSLAVLIASCAAPSAAQSGLVQFPVIHSTNTKVFGKRAVELPLTNRTDVAYYAQLNIGTPAQSVYVQLDTGSFELWVNPDCASTTLSNSDAAFCKTVGVYTSSKSSTAKSLSKTKTLQYGIGSANITYFTDSINLPGSTSTLSSVQFGVASATTSEFAGILGIGYGLGITTNYKNFVDELAAQNVTKVKAYTLALGSKDAKEGVIVFGGVDTSKFSGKLAKQPIIPTASTPDQVPRFWINMAGLSLSPPNTATKNYADSNIPVFLDSGSTMTLLPTDLANAIAADFGASTTDSNGFYEVSCSLVNLAGTVNFAFNGTTIKVPYKEIIRVVSGPTPSCFLGISPSESFTLLGDTFMRSAYTVFDLDSNVVWLSQASQCGSTPAAITDSNVLSTVTGVCASSSSGTAGDAASGSTSSSSTSKASSTAASTASTASSAASSTSTAKTGNNSASTGERVKMNSTWALVASFGTLLALTMSPLL